VLVVDDSPAARAALVQPLEGWGCFVREAADGMEGLAALRDDDFDLVLVDIEMPVLDGIGMLRAAREMGFKKHFALVSSRVDTRSTSDGLKLGATEFLLKPVRADELLHLVARMTGFDGTTVHRMRGRLLVVDHDPAVGQRLKALLPAVDVVETTSFEETVHGGHAPSAFEAILVGVLDKDAAVQEQQDETLVLVELLSKRNPDARVFSLGKPGGVAAFAGELDRGLGAAQVDALLARRAFGMMPHVAEETVRLGRFSGNPQDLKAYWKLQTRCFSSFTADLPGSAVVSVLLHFAPTAELEALERSVQTMDVLAAGRGLEAAFRGPRALMDTLVHRPALHGINLVDEGHAAG
jgi:CheY-like chemotaxis protein